MARGFESKSVQEQWQDAEAAADARKKPKRSAEQIEHEFETQPVHQGHIEPHACIASVNEHGQLQVWDANKMPFRQQNQLAPLLDMPVEGIDFHATWAPRPPVAR